jgi:hypothetical protein
VLSSATLTSIRFVHCHHSDTLRALAAVGVIPALVKLLGRGLQSDVQTMAAGSLVVILTVDGGACVAAVVTAGAIPAAVQLLGPGPDAPDDLREQEY